MGGQLPSRVMFPKAKEPFSGSANQTVTFNDRKYGLYLSNDGASDVTVTVNSEVFTVKAGKEFREYFDPFITATITGTTAYHGHGLE